MAETQEPSIGWGGEVWLHDGSALYELRDVVSFKLPNDEVDEVETTHLKSPGRRKEYISGLIDGGSVEVVLNYRPGSDTDTKILAARDAGDSRAVKFVIPYAGEAAYEIDTTAIVRAYDRGEVAAGDKMQATLTLRITGDQSQSAAS